MFKRSTISLKQKAKPYRQWLEKMHVYPFPFEISSRKYYLVDFVKFKRAVGTGVFSEGQEIIEDARKAHRRLYQFYRLSEKIQDEGRARAQVSLDLYRIPLKKMDEQPDKSIDEGYTYIKKLLQYQKEYQKTYKDFQNYIKEQKEKELPLTETELELAIDTAAKLKTVQEHIMHLLAQSHVLKEWKEAMEQIGLWDKLNSNQKAFYKQFIRNEAFMKAEAEKVTIGGGFDHTLKKNRTEMARYMIKEQKADEEVLRYP